MAQEMLETLRAVDPAVLTEVVRQDQHSPTFAIVSWTVERFGDGAIYNSDGLFRFSGQGRDSHGVRPWSIVLKNLKDPGTNVQPRHLRYWKRELLAMQSGLLTTLPGPIVAPRCYRVDEREGSGWLWLEHVADSANRRWTTDQYVFAARELGRFNGNCLNTTIPDYPWLCRTQVPDKVEALPPEQAWDNPFVQQAYSAQVRERVMRLWAERDRFYDAIKRLPQAFSHFDYHRRNLLIRRRDDGSDQMVAIDWAWCGFGPLGADLYTLIGGSALIFELETREVAELEAAAFDAYVAGLRGTGWQGNPDTVRLAYDLYFALYLAGTTPATTAGATADDMEAFVVRQFKRSREDIAMGWAALCELALDRADEARTLMDRLS